ncbi:MAG: ABC transporter permease [Caldilineaceae bacterium]
MSQFAILRSNSGQVRNLQFFTRPRWHKVWRDLWLYRARTILVILSIAVGVFAVGMIASAWFILAREMPASYAEVHPASAILYTQDFDDTLLQSISQMRGVADAVGRRTVALRLQSGTDQWVRAEFNALSSYQSIPVNKVLSVDGAASPADKAVLIERGGMAMINGQVGNKLTIENADGVRRSLQLSGVAYDPSLPPSTFTGIVYGFINDTTLQWLGEPRAYNQLYFTVSEKTGDREHIQQVTNAVRKQVTRAGVKVFAAWVPNPGEHPTTTIVQAVLLVLAVLGVTSLCASAFLVVNTVSAVLTQQTRQIGVMKAIGANTRQLQMLYCGMIVVYGLIASLVAMPLATVAAIQLSRFVAGLLNFDILSFRIPLWVLGLEVGVGLLTPLAAGWLPIRRGASMSIRDALDSRAAGAAELQAGWLARGLAWFNIGSRPFLLALRNTFRRKGRLVLSLLTLTLGGALLISIFSIYSSVQRTVEAASLSWQYDLAVYFSRDYLATRLEQTLQRSHLIAEIESWYVSTTRRQHAYKSESDDIEVLAIPAETKLINPVLIAGRWLRPDESNGVVINSQLLEHEPDLQVGSQFTVKLNERKITWQVVGIVRSALDGQRIYINYASFVRSIRRVGETNTIRVTFKEGNRAALPALVSGMESAMQEAGLRVNFLQTTTDQREQVRFQFNILLIFLAVMALLVMIVGGIGLMGTMSINVLERVSEIGILRAVGASTWAILRIFLGEGLLIGGLSWLLSVPLSYPLSQLLSDQLGLVLLQAPLDFQFSNLGVACGLVFIVVVAFAATFFPARRATQISIRETLAYE